MMFGTAALQRTLQSAFDAADVTLTQGEMALAAGTVVGARMKIAVQPESLGAAAFELQRIVPEKLQAFSDAGAAVAAEWWRLNRDAGEYLLYLTRGMSTVQPPAPADVVEFLDRMTAHGALLAGSAAGLTAAALAPFHMTVTRNARRLARQR
jgi:hypothetical protein